MAKTQLHPFWNEKVGYLPLQKPLFLEEKKSIADAIHLMQKKKRGCLLILDESQLLKGVVTERDFMSLYVGANLTSKDPISKVMTKNVFTISPEEDIATVIDLFAIKPFRHFPVCSKKNTVLGLLSVRVLIDFIAEHIPEETLNLPPILGSSPQDTFGG